MEFIPGDKRYPPVFGSCGIFRKIQIFNFTRNWWNCFWISQQPNILQRQVCIQREWDNILSHTIKIIPLLKLFYKPKKSWIFKIRKNCLMSLVFEQYFVWNFILYKILLPIAGMVIILDNIISHPVFLNIFLFHSKEWAQWICSYRKYKGRKINWFWY